MKQSTNKRGNLARKLKQLDLFGHPITLKYKNKSTFQSAFGGIITIIITVGILGYFLLQLKAVANKEQFQVINSLSKRSMADNETLVVLNKDNFDLGISLSYIGEDQEIRDNLDLYFSLQLEIVSYEVNLTQEFIKEFGSPFQMIKTNVQLELCNEERFGNLKHDAEGLGITNHHYCPVSNFTFKLQGSFSASTAELLQLTIDYCSKASLAIKYPGKNKTCKSQKEANKILDKIYFFAGIMTSFFDQQDFSDNPIKNQINYDTFVQLQENFSQQYLFKLSQNHAILQDSWFSSLYKNQNLSFIDMRNVFTTLGPKASITDGIPIVTIQFTLDENIITVERKVQTIFDAISQTGGLMGILFAFATSLIGWIQEFLFHSSLMKRMFYTQKPNLEAPSMQRGKGKGQKKSKHIRIQSIDSTNKSHSNLFSASLHQQQFDNSNNNSIFVEEINEANSSQTTQVVFAPNYDNHQQRQQQEKAITQLGKIAMITQYVTNLQPFCYDFKKFIRYKLRGVLIGYCKKKRRLNTKDILYRIGITKIQSQFDIVQVFKQMKKIELLTQISLSRYQQFFLPILRSNVLSKDQDQLISQPKQESSQTLDDTSQQVLNNRKQEFPPKDESILTIEQKRLGLYIQQLALQSLSSKIDKRILKNLGILKEDDNSENPTSNEVQINNNQISQAVTDRYQNKLLDKIMNGEEQH